MAKYKICKGHAKEVMLKAPWLRKQFLSKKLQETLENERLKEEANKEKMRNVTKGKTTNQRNETKSSGRHWKLKTCKRL